MHTTASRSRRFRNRRPQPASDVRAGDRRLGTRGAGPCAPPPFASMRYIGNKTRLLPFILRTLKRLGVNPGTAHDAFSGTAAVGRALKSAGWRVVSSDLMTYSYVLQRAYVVASRMPSFTALVAGDAGLRRALRSPALRVRAASRGAGRLGAVAEYL